MSAGPCRKCGWWSCTGHYYSDQALVTRPAPTAEPRNCREDPCLDLPACLEAGRCLASEPPAEPPAAPPSEPSTDEDDTVAEIVGIAIVAQKLGAAPPRVDEGWWDALYRWLDEQRQTAVREALEARGLPLVVMPVAPPAAPEEDRTPAEPQRPPTDEQSFWNDARAAQAEVDSWPQWKRDACARALVSREPQRPDEDRSVMPPGGRWPEVGTPVSREGWIAKEWRLYDAITEPLRTRIATLRHALQAEAGYRARAERGEEAAVARLAVVERDFEAMAENARCLAAERDAAITRAEAAEAEVAGAKDGQRRANVTAERRGAERDRARALLAQCEPHIEREANIAIDPAALYARTLLAAIRSELEGTR